MVEYLAPCSCRWRYRILFRFSSLIFQYHTCCCKSHFCCCCCCCSCSGVLCSLWFVRCSKFAACFPIYFTIILHFIGDNLSICASLRCILNHTSRQFMVFSLIFVFTCRKKNRFHQFYFQNGSTKFAALIDQYQLDKKSIFVFRVRKFRRIFFWCMHFLFIRYSQQTFIPPRPLNTRKINHLIFSL